MYFLSRLTRLIQKTARHIKNNLITDFKGNFMKSTVTRGIQLVLASSVFANSKAAEGLQDHALSDISVGLPIGCCVCNNLDMRN